MSKRGQMQNAGGWREKGEIKKKKCVMMMEICKRITEKEKRKLRREIRKRQRVDEGKSKRRGEDEGEEENGREEKLRNVLIILFKELRGICC